MYLNYFGKIYNSINSHGLLIKNKTSMYHKIYLNYLILFK